MKREEAPKVTAASGVVQYAGIAKAREFLKLKARSIAYREPTRRWMDFLNSHEFYARLVAHNPYLLRKIYRSYLTNKLDCAQRVSQLIGHYGFARSIGWNPVILKAAGAPMPLAEFAGKSAARYRLTLESGMKMDREGDLALRLFREDTLICSCSFSFLKLDRWCIAIGGLQGPRHDGLALMREAGRDFFGLHPKRLMMKLVRNLGHELGAGKVYLVGNDNHALASFRKDGKLLADYDGFWESCGALLRADGNFELDCVPLQPPVLADFVAKKRSAISKQYELLCEVCGQADQALKREVAAQESIPTIQAIRRHSDGLFFHLTDNLGSL